MVLTDVIGVIMVFSIPIIAIITSHIRSNTKIKGKLIQEQLELEKLKHQNFLLETEKMRLELEKMNQIDTKDTPKIP
ncbi:hypothetical protein P5X88_07865 [Heyndrickxia oleronia]|uniref:Uncharacterized protein n=1 Tax=Heyndrickxia oleronia TaxID=38875 RepID=A0AAW6SY06_9BACI|nr:hypothetical protein [Heyndrickxia oleronia]MDH5160851.1 hypothetical protein [Heyndrickxia oleronia]